MSGPVIAVPKHGKLGEGFSRRDIYDSLEHPGRRTTPHGYQSAASWIDDMMALRKLILLCSFDANKFNFRRYHYRKTILKYDGKCDACKQDTRLMGGGTAYVHESEYQKVCIDPSEARKRRRAALGGQSPWRFIQNQRR